MQTKAFLHLASASMVAALVAPAAAQTRGLPEPPRSVYRCEAEGKVTYSDEPCLGAKRVELQPTRGLNKSSGRELTGRDVGNERHRELVAEAVRPITGMDSEQFKTAGKRSRLDPDAQRECRALDHHIARSEAEEKAATGADLASLQQALLSARKRHREVGC